MSPSPLDHPDQSGGSCPRDQGYTALMRETAGTAYGNPAGQLVTKLMCHRCGCVFDAPAVEHPALRPGYRAP